MISLPVGCLSLQTLRRINRMLGAALPSQISAVGNILPSVLPSSTPQQLWAGMTGVRSEPGLLEEATITSVLFPLPPFFTFLPPSSTVLTAPCSPLSNCSSKFGSGRRQSSKTWFCLQTPSVPASGPPLPGTPSGRLTPAPLDSSSGPAPGRRTCTPFARSWQPCLNLRIFAPAIRNRTAGCHSWYRVRQDTGGAPPRAPQHLQPKGHRARAGARPALAARACARPADPPPLPPRTVL